MKVLKWYLLFLILLSSGEPQKNKKWSPAGGWYGTTPRTKHVEPIYMMNVVSIRRVCSKLLTRYSLGGTAYGQKFKFMRFHIRLNWPSHFIFSQRWRSIKKTVVKSKQATIPSRCFLNDFQPWRYVNIGKQVSNCPLWITFDFVFLNF